MTEKEVIDILNDDIEVDHSDDDHVFLGLQLIHSLVPKSRVINMTSGQGMLWSVEIKELVSAGITEDQVVQLCKWNWGHCSDTNRLYTFC